MYKLIRRIRLWFSIDLRNIEFSPQGTGAYEFNAKTNHIRQWVLSKPYDMTSGTRLNGCCGHFPQSEKIERIYLPPDGRYLYGLGKGRHTVHKCELTGRPSNILVRWDKMYILEWIGWGKLRCWRGGKSQLTDFAHIWNLKYYLIREITENESL